MDNVLWLDNGQPGQVKHQGYIVASEYLRDGISKHGLHVHYFDNFADTELSFDTQFWHIEHEIRIRKRKTSNYKIIVNNCLPDQYKKKENYSIGFTYWETDQLPPDWVTIMNTMDEIWTTSVFMKNVFINSGITVPVFNFKLGFNHNIYKKTKKVDNGKFTFLHDGSPSLRKNPQIAVDAFLKLFDGDDRYHLILKSVGNQTARWYKDGTYMGSLVKHPQITLVNEMLPEKENAELYSKADCMIYPTSGEGWGMMPFQSLAMGIPTICTDFSACNEYASMSIPLGYQLQSHLPGIYGEAGNWAMPNVDELCDKMLHVVNNYDMEKSRAEEAADILHQNYKWTDVSEDYYKRLCQILNQ